MFIHVKVVDSTITHVIVHPTKSSIDGYVCLAESTGTGSAKQELIDWKKGEIKVGSDTYFYEVFCEFCDKFQVDANGILSYKPGVNAGNIADDRLVSLDMSVPLSFTRANTIVNFGRL